MDSKKIFLSDEVFRNSSQIQSLLAKNNTVSIYVDLSDEDPLLPNSSSAAHQNERRKKEELIDQTAKRNEILKNLHVICDIHN
ncbi:unnamed protein product [Toxocara canis]|uniref:BHLH domain-containing protein n=1 Tax=Toxocara canis TaxID=6265 RepID=A0A183UIM8_TOXCA|nr:unnamed protein product [Toxocara canis]